ncbi:MAG: hypothetical protein ACYC3Q_03985 [Gemmatimonadaceae bacterium]
MSELILGLLPVRDARLLVLVAGLALAGGCDGERLTGTSSNPYTIRADSSSYAAGSIVTVSARNDTRSTIVVGECGYRLLASAGSGWALVASGPPGGCDLAGRVLRPGESTIRRVPLPGDATAGTYRVAVGGIGSPDPAIQLSEDAVSTPPFQVR